MKFKLTDFQRSVGIGSGLSGVVLEGAGFSADTLRMIEFKCLLTYIGVATKIHLTLVRMSSHVPYDHLMLHNVAR